MYFLHDRLGADGKPLLNRPKLDLCEKRKFHEKFGDHHYFLSWREPWNKFEVSLHIFRRF
jgi:hypothetical protein